MFPVIVILAGLALWQVATIVLGPEPWDSTGYLGFLAVAMALSGVFAWLRPEGAWRWGLLLILTQIPVMLLNASPNWAPDGLMFVGLAYLALQAFAAAVAATAVRHLRRSRV